MGIDRTTLRRLINQTADRAIAGARQETASREASLKKRIKKMRRDLVLAAAQSLHKFVSGTLKARMNKPPLECHIAVRNASFKNSWEEDGAIILLPESPEIKEAQKELSELEPEMRDTIEDHQTQRDILLAYVSTAENSEAAEVNARVQRYLKTGVGA